jgi:hypothetical protein
MDVVLGVKLVRSITRKVITHQWKAKKSFNVT